MRRVPLTCCYVVKRVTGIELALSAWEAERFRLVAAQTWKGERSALAVADPSSPWLMALWVPKMQ